MNRNTKKLQPLKKLFLLTLIIAFSSCFSQKINKTEKSYIITKYKSKDKNSWYLNLETFEYENRTKRFYSVYHINNVVFSDHDLKPLNPSITDSFDPIASEDKIAIPVADASNAALEIPSLSEGRINMEH